MNLNNFNQLKDQVNSSGFGDSLDQALKENIELDASEFTLKHEPKIVGEKLSFILHFRKSDKHDMYFFNKYVISLKTSHQQETLQHIFYINKGNNISVKEAYNLLSGRAVNKDLTSKEGKVYNTWIQLDFSQVESNGNHKQHFFHQNYGFNLEKCLSNLPIKEFDREKERAFLIQSLQKGNLQPVTFLIESVEYKMFIEADPRFKTVNVYNEQMQKMENQIVIQKRTRKVEID